VVINVSGNIAITHSTGQDTVHSLQCEDNLTLSGGTLTLAFASVIDGGFTLSGGTLRGPGDLTLNGAFTWSGNGTMTGGGHTRANGSSTLSTLSMNNHTFDNAGSATIATNTFSLTLGNGAVFNNLAGATFDVQTDASISASGNAAFNNAGTVLKSNSSGTTFLSAFNNSGTVEVQTGTIQLFGGSLESGTFTVDAGATLAFSVGTYALTPSSLVTGAGDVTFNAGVANLSGAYTLTGNTTLNGGTANFIADATLPTLTLLNGTLDGEGTLTVSGLLTWQGGTMSGTGRTEAAGGIALTDPAAGLAPTLSRVLDNQGTATWTSARNFTITAGVWNNLAGSLFDIRNDAQVIPNVFGVLGTFNNAGTVRKALSSDVTTLRVVFNNSGTLDLQTGTVVLSGGGTSDGTFSAAAGATLNFGGGSHLLTANSSVSGAGSVVFGGGTTTVSGAYNIPAGTTIAGGTVNFLADTELPNLTLSGGFLTGTSTVTIDGLLTWTGGGMSDVGRTVAAGGIAISGSGTKTLDRRTLDNLGNATWAGTGNFSILNGAVLNNPVGSLFEIHSDASFGIIVQSFGGRFDNAGTVRKTASSGTTTFLVTFNNSGILDLQTGTFAMTGGGISNGAFTGTTGTTLNFSSFNYLLTLSSSVSTAGSVVFGGSTTTVSGAFEASAGTTIIDGTVNFTNDVTLSTLTLNGFSGGLLTGSGNVTVTGLLNWTNGSMSGTGHTIANGGIVVGNATFFGNNPLLDGRTLDNKGTADLIGQGLRVSNGAVWNNAVGSVFEFTNPSGISNVGGATSVFNNAGTVRKVTSNNSTSSLAMQFVSSGTVQVQTGTLSFEGGGNSTLGAGSTVTGPGGVHVATNLSVLGTYNIGGATTLDGGTLSFAQDVTLPTLILNGGTLTGAGNITVSGLLTWNNGSMTGGGRTKANGGVALSSTNSASFPTLDGRELDNAGTATFTGTSFLLIINGGLWNNLTGSLFDIQSNVLIGGAANPGSFVNAGTFRKSAGTGTTSVDPVFSNFGTLEVDSGTVFLGNNSINESSSSQMLAGGTYLLKGSLQFGQVNSLTTNAAAVVLDGTNARILGQFGNDLLTGLSANLAEGSLTVRNGRSLTLSGGFTTAGSVTLGSGSILTANGSYTQLGGNTALAGGQLKATGGVAIQGGALSGPGTIQGNLTNAGLIRPGDGGTGVLTIQGNYTQTAAGELDVNLGGTTAGTQYDQLAVTGAATLDGILAVKLVNGFSPSLGASFQVLVFGSRTGDFANKDLPDLGSSLFLDPVYDGIHLTLVVKAKP
jgi:hypothetical protein